jgi:hypothetical protein
MPSRQKETQTCTYSETKPLEGRCRVFRPAMPLEIILPVNWPIVFDAILDGTHPVVLAMFVHGLDMTL